MRGRWRREQNVCVDRAEAALMSLIWLTSRRDLSWRRRSLVIAVCGTSLVFALALLLWGFREGLDVEASRTVRSLGADAFVVDEAVAGPFTSLAQLDASLADRIGELEGVTDAAPIVSIRHSIESSPVTDVYLVGAVPGRVGMPTRLDGRAPQRLGEAALGSAAQRQVGDRIQLGGRSFEVVGIVPGVGVWANIPVMYVTLEEAQQLVFAGKPVATSILTKGVPQSLPAGLTALSPGAATEDLKRPTANAIDTVDLLRILLWIVAAAIVGSVLYISAIERSRDFAVFKAFGTSNRDLVGTLVVEAVIITSASTAFGIGIARPMAALFPAVISFPARILLLLPAVALVVGLLGALAGARRAIGVDPATAFAGR